ncbi:MAG: PGF-pre-PGF domain-containing protein [Methanolobus sp.]|nr:PGF-pre-PGF domain-containing protein [Methanolobus sp.]
MSSIQGIVKISFCIALLVLAVTLSAAGGSSSGNSTESTSYNITIADAIDGTANVTVDKSNAAVNETVIVTITDIEVGKQFSSINVAGDVVSVLSTEVIAGANYTFQMPAENVTVTVTLEDIPVPVYNVIVEPVVGGTASVTVDKPSAEEYEIVTVTIDNIETGKQFAFVNVTGNSGPVATMEEAPGVSYTFTMPAENVTVNVTLLDIPVKYGIQTEVTGGNAIVTTDPAPEAEKGTNVTITISEIGSGKQFNSIKVKDATNNVIDTKVLYEGLSYTFTMPAQEVTVIVDLKDPTIHVASIVVTGEGSANTVKNGKNLQMSAAISPVDATDASVTWSVEAVTGNATITQSGLLTGTEVGTVIVKAKANDGFGAEGVLEVTVTVKPVIVNGIEVYTAPNKTSYNEGETLDLTGLVVELTKSDSSIEHVEFAYFEVKGIKVSPVQGSELGTEVTQVLITHNASAETATQAINVNAVPVTITNVSIKTAPSKVTYTEGDALDLNGLVITLTRSNSSTEDVAFANFNSKGIVVAPANGIILTTTNTSVTITHTESGETATQTITVNAVPVTVSSINVTAAGYVTTVENGKTLQMTAAVLPTNAIDKTVTWSIINGTGTATITQTGLLTGTAVGTVTVKATSNDGSNIADIYNITVSEAQSATTPTTGGGGGGGGGQSTGEKYENIELKDYSIKYVLRDTETMFEFTKEGNSIVGIGFTARLNGGQTKTVIEMLKSTSTMVNKAAPGTVYKNVNIWVGDGKTTPDLLSDARIMFKVEKAWIAGNGIDPASIRMLRYNSGSWAQLPTSRVSEDETYVYYITQTPGFSAFAISSIGKEEQQVISGSNQQGSPSPSGESAQMSTEDSQTPQAGNAVSPEAKSSGSFTFLLILAGISALGVLGYRYKDQLSQVRTQLGNPDGKRYRRFKRS